MNSFSKTVSLDIGKTEVKVREALASEGFGVLSEMDIAKTLQEKIQVHRSPLKILGACNPTLANQALEADESVALMLPCNVVLSEVGGVTTVSIVDPREMLLIPGLEEAANTAADKLSRVLELI